jgi:hypothetical protein
MRRARHVDAIVCARVPLRWFCDMTTWFKLSESGRIFKTDRVVMYQESPGEMHMDKRNPGPNSLERVGDKVQQIKLEPYAHYETMLKPWRRTIPPQSRKPWRLDRHPSVFAQEPKYLDRFLGIKRAAEEAKKRKVSMSVRDRVRLAKRGMKNVKKLRTR